MSLKSICRVWLTESEFVGQYVAEASAFSIISTVEQSAQGSLPIFHDPKEIST